MNKGFTLLELMVVIAIICILAVAAAPGYKDRITRTQVVEALRFADGAEKSVAAFYLLSGRFPANNAEAGLPEASKFIGSYVTRLEIVDGAIDLTLGNRITADMAGKKLTLRPAVVKGERLVPVSWVCGMASVPAGLEIHGDNQTDLQPQQLPLDCRI